jgi:hypothetical protein
MPHSIVHPVKSPETGLRRRLCHFRLLDLDVAGGRRSEHTGDAVPGADDVKRFSSSLKPAVKRTRVFFDYGKIISGQIPQNFLQL